MGGKPTDLFQCSDAVSVVATCDDWISQGVVGHLNRGVGGVRLFSCSSCDETRLLVIIDLSRLHLSNLWIIEVARDIVGECKTERDFEVPSVRFQAHYRQLANNESCAMGAPPRMKMIAPPPIFRGISSSSSAKAMFSEQTGWYRSRRQRRAPIAVI